MEAAHVRGVVAGRDALDAVVGDREEDNPADGADEADEADGADEADDDAAFYGDHKEEHHGRAIQVEDVEEVLAETSNQQELEDLQSL